MIVITGAGGMIGSVIAWHFNSIENFTDLILCDDLKQDDQEKNYAKRKFLKFVHKDQLFDFLEIEKKNITGIFHMGAISATTEKIFSNLIKDNIRYSQQLWIFCSKNKIPLVFASSAATYGNGKDGYSDIDDEANFNPLNAYGYSKYFFDQWVSSQQKLKVSPPYWYSCKFFNVYGPNEYHKGRMASVVYHAYNQYKNETEVRLFKSDNPEYKDGMQLRDFIYVKDAVKAIIYLFKNKAKSGIYNIGTGKAQSFKALAEALIKNANGTNEQIKYIEMPDDLKGKYQYFTEATIEKLRRAGYDETFYNLDAGVTDYYQNYLSKKDQYL
ncbi:MAG: ADP-glyceromanno-heptose 6-epimerase [Nitrosomonadales bacterium]|jgi:ADP-L-glycero-D-manno-heptose 6-epimerase